MSIMSKSEEINKKLHNLRSYIPFVQRMISKIECSSSDKGDCLSKLKGLLSFLTNPSPKIKTVEMLDKMENLIKGLFKNADSKKGIDYKEQRNVKPSYSMKPKDKREEKNPASLQSSSKVDLPQAVQSVKDVQIEQEVNRRKSRQKELFGEEDEPELKKNTDDRSKKANSHQTFSNRSSSLEKNNPNFFHSSSMKNNSSFSRPIQTKKSDNIAESKNRESKHKSSKDDILIVAEVDKISRNEPSFKKLHDLFPLSSRPPESSKMTMPTAFTRDSKNLVESVKPFDTPVASYPHSEQLDTPESPEPDENKLPKNRNSPTPAIPLEKAEPSKLPAPQVNLDAIKKALNFINTHEKSKKELTSEDQFRYEDFIGPASTGLSKSYDQIWDSKPIEASSSLRNMDSKHKKDQDPRTTKPFKSQSSINFPSGSHSQSVSKSHPTPLHRNKPQLREGIDSKRSSLLTNLSSIKAPEKHPELTRAEPTKKSSFSHSNELIKLGHKGVAASQLESYKLKRDSKINVNFSSRPTLSKNEKVTEGLSILDQLLPNTANSSKHNEEKVSDKFLDSRKDSTSFSRITSSNPQSFLGQNYSDPPLPYDNTTRCDPRMKPNAPNRNSFPKDPRLAQNNLPPQIGLHNRDPRVTNATKTKDPRLKDNALSNSSPPSVSSYGGPMNYPRPNQPAMFRGGSSQRDPRSQQGHMMQQSYNHRALSPHFNQGQPHWEIGPNSYHPSATFPRQQAMPPVSQPKPGLLPFPVLPSSSSYHGTPLTSNVYAPPQDPSNSAIGNTFTCLMLQGLPSYTNSSHIYKLLEEFILRDLCIEIDEAYNCKGTAYVYFPSHASAKEAYETVNGKFIQNHKIHLRICSVGILRQAKRTYDLMNFDREKYLEVPQRPKGNGNPFYKQRPKERVAPPIILDNLNPVKSYSSQKSSSDHSLSKPSIDAENSFSTPGYSKLCGVQVNTTKKLNDFKIPKKKPVIENTQVESSPKNLPKAKKKSLDHEQKIVSCTDSDDINTSHILHTKKNRRYRKSVKIIESDSDSETSEIVQSIKTTPVPPIDTDSSIDLPETSVNYSSSSDEEDEIDYPYKTSQSSLASGSKASTSDSRLKYMKNKNSNRSKKTVNLDKISKPYKPLPKKSSRKITTAESLIKRTRKKLEVFKESKTKPKIKVLIPTPERMVYFLNVEDKGPVTKKVQKHHDMKRIPVVQLSPIQNMGLSETIIYTSDDQESILRDIKIEHDPKSFKRKLIGPVLARKSKRMKRFKPIWHKGYRKSFDCSKKRLLSPAKDLESPFKKIKLDKSLSSPDTIFEHGSLPIDFVGGFQNKEIVMNDKEKNELNEPIDCNNERSDEIELLVKSSLNIESTPPTKESITNLQETNETELEFNKKALVDSSESQSINSSNDVNTNLSTSDIESKSEEIIKQSKECSRLDVDMNEKVIADLLKSIGGQRLREIVENLSVETMQFDQPSQEAESSSIKNITQHSQEAESSSIKNITQHSQEAESSSIKNITQHSQEAESSSIKNVTQPSQEAELSSIKMTQPIQEAESSSNKNVTQPIQEAESSSIKMTQPIQEAESSPIKMTQPIQEAESSSNKNVTQPIQEAESSSIKNVTSDKTENKDTSSHAESSSKSEEECQRNIPIEFDVAIIKNNISESVDSSIPKLSENKEQDELKSNFNKTVEDVDKKIDEKRSILSMGLDFIDQKRADSPVKSFSSPEKSQYSLSSFSVASQSIGSTVLVDSDNDEVNSISSYPDDSSIISSYPDDSSIVSSEGRDGATSNERKDISTPELVGGKVSRRMKREKNVAMNASLIDRRRITRGTLVVPVTENILWNDGGYVDLFQCDQCDYVGKMRAHHLINFHSDREVPCHFKKEDFNPVLKDSLGPTYNTIGVKLDLKRLPQQMIFDKEIECDFEEDCDYISSNRFDFIYHLLEHQPKALPTMHHCRLCNFMADELESFYDHVASHTGEYRHTCERCGQKGFSIDSLDLHHKDYHEHQSKEFKTDEMVLEDGFPYINICKSCLYTQIKKENVEAHVQKKHNGRADIIKANMSRHVFITTEKKKDLEVKDKSENIQASQIRQAVPKRKKLLKGTKRRSSKFAKKSKKSFGASKGKVRRSDIADLAASSSENVENHSPIQNMSVSSSDEISSSVQNNVQYTEDLNQSNAVSKRETEVGAKGYSNIETPIPSVTKHVNVFLGQAEQTVDPESNQKSVDQLVDRILLNNYSGSSRNQTDIKRKISSLNLILDKVVTNDNQSELVDDNNQAECVDKNLTLMDKKLGFIIPQSKRSLSYSVPLQQKDRDSTLDSNVRDNLITCKLSDIENKKQLCSLIGRLKTSLDDDQSDVNVLQPTALSSQPLGQTDLRFLNNESVDTSIASDSRNSSLPMLRIRPLHELYNTPQLKQSQSSEVSQASATLSNECTEPNCNFKNSIRKHLCHHMYMVHQKFVCIFCSFVHDCGKIFDHHVQEFHMIRRFRCPDNCFNALFSSSEYIKHVTSVHMGGPNSIPISPIKEQDTSEENFLKIESYGTLDATSASQMFEVEGNAPDKSVKSVEEIKKEILSPKQPSPVSASEVSPHEITLKPPTIPLEIFFSKYQSVDVFQTYLSNKAFPVFKCMVRDCSFVSQSTKGFQAHLANHEDQEWRCCYCLIFMPTRDILVEHVLSEHSHCQFQCKYCLYRSYTQIYVGVHVKRFHPNETAKYIKVGTIRTAAPSNQPIENVIRPYKCSFERCNFRTVDTDGFRQHARLHGENFILSCPYCDFSSLADKLIIHMQSHELNEFQCPYCLFGEGERDKLLSHLLNIHPGRPGKVLLRKQVSSSSIVATPSTSSGRELEVASSSYKENANSESPQSTRTASITTQISKLQTPTSIPAPHIIKSSDSKTTTPSAANEGDQENSGLSGYNLYRCGNEKCSFSCLTLNLFKEHLQVCDFSRDSPLLKCYHCSKHFRHLTGLLDHIKVHGPKRFLCGIEGCTYRATVVTSFKYHMKQLHHITAYKTGPKDLTNKNPESQEFIVYPKDSSIPFREPHKKKKNEFATEDIDKIPIAHVSHQELKCYHCMYATKIRLNLVKHLRLHETRPLSWYIPSETVSSDASKSIPFKQPINPVPRLESKELMFDKMMNLAGSSMDDKRKMEENALRTQHPIPQEELDLLPKLVPLEKVNCCGIQGCKYLSCDEVMLKYHIETLHSDAVTFQCPHCNNPYALTSESFVDHYKLHGEKLYRCGWCSHLAIRHALIERHLKDIHPVKTPFFFTVRESESKDPDEPDATKDKEAACNHPQDARKVDVSLNKKISILPQDSTLHEKEVESSGKSLEFRWGCCLCPIRVLTHSEILNHMNVKHDTKHQYKCGFCNFKSSTPTAFEAHHSSKHSDKKEVTVHCLYFQIGAEDIVPIPQGGDTSTHDPIWKRNDPERIKQIRGILLEDECDKETSLLNIEPGDPVDNEFVCPKCRSFKTPCVSTFRSHLCKEANYQRFGCSECGTTNPLLASIRRHFTKIHGSQFSSDSYITLPVESTLEAWVESIISHQEHIIESTKPAPLAMPSHSASPSGQMTRRNSNGGNSSTVESEVEAESTIAESVLEKVKHICQHCSHECKNIAGLKNHIHLKHPIKVTCQYCSFMSSTDVGLRTHMGIKHPESAGKVFRFECPYCPFKTNTGNKISAHKQTHVEIREFICLYCDKRFESMTAGNIHHSHKHQGEPFKVIHKPVGAKQNIADLKTPTTSKEELNTEVPFPLEVKKQEAYNCCHCGETGDFSFMEGHMKSQHNSLPFVTRKKLPDGGFYLEQYAYECNHCSHPSLGLMEAMNHWVKNHVTLDFKFNLVLSSSSFVKDVKEESSPAASSSSKLAKSTSKTEIVAPVKTESSITSSEISQKDAENNEVSSSTSDMVYKCYYCRKTSNLKSEIENHSNVVHVGKAMKITSYLSGERIKPTRGGNFECGHCLVQGSMADMKLHMVKDHPTLETNINKVIKSPRSGNDGSFRCDVCLHVVKFRKSIKAHMQRLHPTSLTAFTQLHLGLPLTSADCRIMKCNHCLQLVSDQLSHHDSFHSNLDPSFSLTSTTLQAASPKKENLLVSPVIPKKNTARKSFSSTSSFSSPLSSKPVVKKTKQIATKSTSGRPLRLAILRKSDPPIPPPCDFMMSPEKVPLSEDEEEELRSSPTSQIDEDRIYTNYNLLGGIPTRISVSQLSNIIDLHPEVRVEMDSFSSQLNS